MMGRSHLIAGVCALEHAYAASVLIDRADTVLPSYMAEQLMKVKRMSQLYLGIADMTELSVLTMTVIPVYLGFYLLGNLLPDIDSPKSLLGRIVHVPVEHRTWLHAIYLYLIIAALGFVHPVFSWLFFGVFVHLFWDSFSACGNCWFYKILSDYRKYPGDAKVKKGHKLKLYHAGEWSEYLLLFIIVVVTVASFVLIMR